MPRAACLTSGKPAERGETLSPPRSDGAHSRQPKRSVIRKESTKMPGDCGDRDTLLGCRGMSRNKLPGAGRDAKAFGEVQETTEWLLD